MKTWGANICDSQELRTVLADLGWPEPARTKPRAEMDLSSVEEKFGIPTKLNTQTIGFKIFRYPTNHV